MHTEWLWTGSMLSSAFCFIFTIILLFRMAKDFDYSDRSYYKEQKVFNEIINNDMYMSFLMASAIKWDN